MTSPHLMFLGFGSCAQELKTTLENHCPHKWLFSHTHRQAQNEKTLLLNEKEHAPELIEALNHVTHILISIPATTKGNQALESIEKYIIKAPCLKWIGYLSTTGVYGDHQGQWVNEKSILNPSGPRGRKRVFAEKKWLHLSQRHHIDYTCFRLAGIYGPHHHVIQNLNTKKNYRILKPQQVFSRIHVQDIAHLLHLAIESDLTGFYNLCDNCPCPSHEVIEWASQTFNFPLPPSISWDDKKLSKMTRSFYDDNKRVSNHKILHQLKTNLIYPSYKEGYFQIMNATNNKI